MTRKNKEMKKIWDRYGNLVRLHLNYNPFEVGADPITTQMTLNEMRFIVIDFLMEVLPENSRKGIAELAREDKLTSNISDGQYIRDWFDSEGVAT